MTKTLTDLKKEPRWAVAKVVPPRKEGQHPGKITVDPQLLLTEGKLRNLKSTEATGWTDYQTASKALTAANMALQEGKIKGVIKFTFSLRITPPLVFIDVDDIQDPEASPEFKKLTKLTKGSYCEVSQSGHGLHYLVEGTLDKAHKGKTYEMYTQGRYVAFTGNQVSKESAIQPLDSKEMQTLISACGFKQPKQPLFTSTPQPTKNSHSWGADNGLTAEQVLANAISNPELRAVASGDYSAYNGDHSSAVQALVNSLAFFANGDAAKTDQAYRLTPSFSTDPKWNASRGETTWGAQTVAGAVNYVQAQHPDHGYFPPKQAQNMRVVEPGERAQGEPLTITIDGQERTFPFNSYFYNRDYEMTETGFANRFANWYAKGKLAYHAGLKTWLMYNPEKGSWMPNEDSRLGKDFNQTPEKLMDDLRINLKKEQHLWLTVGRDPNKPDKQSFGEKAYNKGYERISSAAGQKATLELAQSRLTVREFNTNLTELNTETGWIDLKTGVISPHDPAKLFDKTTGAGMPTQATGGESWDRFIKETFCGDPELIDYVQTSVGYSATGKANEQVMFICNGTGANGKSVFLECINEVLGDYASVIPIETLTNISSAQRDGSAPAPDLASLNGKRFVMTTEPPKKVTIDDGIVKTITGNTKLKVRTLYQKNPVEFLPEFKIWWQSNGLPYINISDYAMLRRLIVIPFDNEVRGNAVDINLKDKLMAEKDYILKWIIEGVAKWQARKSPLFTDLPASVEEATAPIFTTSHVRVDSIKQWLENGNYEEGNTSGARPSVSEVYEDYLNYCKEHGLKVPKAYATSDRKDTLVNRQFNKALKDRYDYFTTRRKNGTVFLGLIKKSSDA
ncbi:MAG: phage/plasmid primase, P4 family [Acetivibrionales bacterium]|jgi:putative DNA primase/helicase